MRPKLSILAAMVLAGAALAPPGADGSEQTLDYVAVYRALPELKRLSDQSTVSATDLHKMMDRLEDGLTTPERQKLLEEIRSKLGEHMRTKQETKVVLRKLLRIPVTEKSDQEVMRIIHGRDLHGINWNDATFRQCVRDLSKALGIRIRMAYQVVQMNRVSMQFRRAPAATVLGSLCNFFQLRYTVQDGEVIIYKKITPTEERFLEYQEKHPDVKLKYWEREDASGEYKKEKKQ